MSPIRHIARRIAASALLFISSCVAARAHQGAVPLTFWGDNFRPADALCQIVVGDGAATCGFGAWTIRRDCLLEELDGGTCDKDAADSAIESLRLDVFRGAIDPVCRDANLPTLSFSDAQDVQFDVVTFCRELEAAAVSVVFNPFFAADRDPQAFDEAQRRCIRGFAAIATKAFRYGFRVRRGALDRIANRRRSARIKTNDVEETDHRIAMANQALRDALVQRCNGADFESLYGMTPDAAVELLASRSACLATSTYPVVAYVCPEAVCGNGMRETGERCDDGNVAPGDGCGPTCQIEF